MFQIDGRRGLSILKRFNIRTLNLATPCFGIFLINNLQFSTSCSKNLKIIIVRENHKF